MKPAYMKSTLKTLALGLLSTGLSIGLTAQSIPEIVADPQGDRVVYTINPGQPNQQVITILNDGSAIVGEETVSIPPMPDFFPEASVNEGGDLVLPDRVIPRPEFFGTTGIEFVFGNMIVPLDAGKTEDTDGWYFSYNLKEIYHWGASYPNFILIRRMGSVFYVITEGVVRTIDEGVWMYAFDFPTANNNTWVFMRNGGGLRDLRDRSGGGSLTGTRITGTIYIFTPDGPGSTPGWFAFTENSAMNEAFVAPVGTNDFTSVWRRSGS